MSGGFCPEDEAWKVRKMEERETGRGSRTESGGRRQIRKKIEKGMAGKERQK